MSQAPPAAAGLGRARQAHRPASSAALRGGWAALRDALHAEWTKLRTLPGHGWLLAALTTLTVAVSTAAAAATHCRAGFACPVDTGKLSLIGVDFGQAVAAILAVLAVGGEYSTGMIGVTFAALPRRITVLAAKAAVVTGPVLAAGILAVGGSLLAGHIILPGHGFTAARGFPPLVLTDGPVARAAAGSVLYLALIALLSVGVAAAVRDSAVAIGIVLGLLYLFPIIAVMAPDPHWQRHLEQVGPMPAGLAIQATRNLHHLPISPWAGLGVLAAWAAAALLAGGLSLRFRDTSPR